MPKSKNKFDWEIYDEEGDFIDILSMTRHDASKYKNKFPKYRLQEIGYSEGIEDDGKEKNLSWKNRS